MHPASTGFSVDRGLPIPLFPSFSFSSPSSSSSSSSLSSSGSSAVALVKRLKGKVSDMSKDLTCAITQELMVDPVIAADGNTYERHEPGGYGQCRLGYAYHFDLGGLERD